MDRLDLNLSVQVRGDETLTYLPSEIIKAIEQVTAQCVEVSIVTTSECIVSDEQAQRSLMSASEALKDVPITTQVTADQDVGIFG